MDDNELEQLTEQQILNFLKASAAELPLVSRAVAHGFIQRIEGYLELQQRRRVHLEARLAKLERVAHAPYDFTELERRLEQLELKAALP